MEDKILVGRGHALLEIPEATWKQHLTQVPERAGRRLDFMTEAHHRVRYFVAKELAREQRPLAPESISTALNVPPGQVVALLDDLERRLFFLVRNEDGMVAWAFPVTTEGTPHRLTFSTGESLYGAWAEDAIAAPFVQGQLRDEHVSIQVETSCRHCGDPMHFTVDSQMQVSVRERDARPLVFMADIEWEHFAERTIIDSYWKNSVFFWSEEHAREYRARTDQVAGVYLTLDQCAYMTPITQGALFAFK